MADKRYDPQEIEAKWQRVWADEHTWEVSNEPDERPKAYVLEMLPYPSGEPHIGHLKTYSVGDAVAHFRRRNGYRVLHPMGYDAFGLPAENHAIKTGQHPRQSTEESIAEFQRQFREWGISIDWTREFGTHEPRYYRWTQWIFLRLFEQGLAYRKEAAVKWCPNDQTVLANEQVIDGHCERCGALVEVRQLEQWFFRITDYADRLLEDMRDIEWPPHVKTMQENWIGRSEGAEVTFRCEELGIDFPVFTTRPDTLFGATFFVMAPEHPDVLRMSDTQEVRDYVNRAINEPTEERGDEHKEKTGVALGRTVTNPVNGEEIPVYVADYVLMEYGTGAIMAVPAHDTRDYEFAEKFGLEIRRVIEGGDELPYTGDGPMVSSGRFDGLHNREAYDAIVDWLEEEGKGKRSVNYRLRDWLLSRQRYWGAPIPIVHCPECGLVPVPDDQLPVELPEIEDYAPKGRSPLAAAEDWVNVDVPELRRSGAARDGHDGHLRRLLLVLPALLRRPQRRGGLGPRGARPLDAGGPVHRRRGARDPAPAVRALLHEGAQRPRAARRERAVRPALHPGDDHPRRGEDVQVEGQRGLAARAGARRHGADTARSYILFIGPPEHDADWQDEGVGGVHRFLSRLWTIAADVAAGGTPAPVASPAEATPLVRKAHWAIDKVTRDMTGRFSFNTAIAAVMELVNEIYRGRDSESQEAMTLRRRHGRLADLPLRPSPRGRGVRAHDRRTGVGGALARRRPGDARAATRSSSWCRSTARSWTGCRPPPTRRRASSRSSRAAPSAWPPGWTAGRSSRPWWFPASS